MLFRNLLLVLGTLTLIAAAVLAVLWVKIPSAALPGGQARNAPPAAVLVANTALPGGTLLRAGDVRWQTVAADATGPADLVEGRGPASVYYGAVVRHPIASGQHLAESDLVLASARTFLAAVLSPGMLGVSLSVDDSQSVSGLVQPGDYVDAILARPMSGNGAAPAAGETVLRNVRVVAVDQLFLPGPRKAGAATALDAAQPKTPKEITLELGDRDAKRLLAAAQMGRVSLVLRALVGADAPDPDLGTPPVWGSEVDRHGGAAAAPRMPAAVRQSVEIIRGSKIAVQ